MKVNTCSVKPFGGLLSSLYSKKTMASLPDQNSPFYAGIKLYDEERHEGEIDLVVELRALLIKAGVPEETLAATYDLNRHVKASKNRISVVQRVQLNRFVELCLITSHVSTIDLRSDMLGVRSATQWLELIEDKIAPFIQEHRLLG